MGNLSNFIDYLHEQVTNHSIYVWGAQGQQGAAITEAWIRKRETTDKNADRAIAFWKKQCDLGFGSVLRAFDCSGLGVCFLLGSKLIPYDHNANGLLGKCDKITKDKLRIGDFVFKVNSVGRATHIGYVADSDLYIIEAKGRDYGVTKSKLSSTWNAFGRPPFWTEAEVMELQGSEPSTETSAGEGDVYVFTRLLKYGVRGDDVKELKKLLANEGYTGLTLGNGNFYSKTKALVKKYQREHNLVPDGVVGPLTIAALGGNWTKEKI
ncbi:MAG: peptidoglycan-binding domain-containing protein [Eubacteriales bacterium]|nr:peptidoglycan-binding domain-containing protein [Eubacteriales bacterium]